MSGSISYMTEPELELVPARQRAGLSYDTGFRCFGYAQEITIILLDQQGNRTEHYEVIECMTDEIRVTFQANR